MGPYGLLDLLILHSNSFSVFRQAVILPRRWDSRYESITHVYLWNAHDAIQEHVAIFLPWAMPGPYGSETHVQFVALQLACRVQFLCSASNSMPGMESTMVQIR